MRGFVVSKETKKFEVERRCAEENGPVFVTKNGYGRLVVMDIDYYEKRCERCMKQKQSWMV